MAPEAGYNHTQGTSHEGMDVGAAHWLIRHTAEALLADGKRIFNLGGTDQIDSGLERFKSGFGLSTSRIELESVQYKTRLKILPKVKSFFNSKARAESLRNFA